MSKRVSYKKLLTEAISEFDTSKTSEVKGPMLDPILSWDGGGELPTNKDAASILERYYFEQDADPGVMVEAEGDDDATEYTSASDVKGNTQKHTQGAGTEQAGTTEKGEMEKREDEIAKEDLDLFLEQDEDEDEDEEKEEEMAESMENAVIEKLIAEMEEEEGEEEEEVEENEKMMAGKQDWEGVKSGVEAKDEKEATDPEEHTQGAGTEQAGTGDDEGKIPDRKDMHDKFVKAHTYEGRLHEQDDEEEEDDEAVEEAIRLFLEQDEEEGAEEGEEEEKELDVDKKMEEGTPLQVIAQDKKEDYSDTVEEAFKIFTEQMEDEEEDEEEEED